MTKTVAKQLPASAAKPSDIARIRLGAGVGALPLPGIKDGGRIRLGAGVGLLPVAAR